MNWKRKDEKLPCRGKLQFEDLIRRLLAGETVPSGPLERELKRLPFLFRIKSLGGVSRPRKAGFPGKKKHLNKPLQAIASHFRVSECNLECNLDFLQRNLSCT